MQMKVHYYDFRFTFSFKFKFNFINFALQLLLKKEKGFPTRYISSRLPTKKQYGMSTQYVLHVPEEKYELPHSGIIILNSRHVAFVPHRLCSRERFSLDGRKVMVFA